MEEKMIPDGELKKIVCSGCSNMCYLDVTMKDGRVQEVSGGGCRRAEISARRQLEKEAI